MWVTVALCLQTWEEYMALSEAVGYGGGLFCESDARKRCRRALISKPPNVSWVHTHRLYCSTDSRFSVITQHDNTSGLYEYPVKDLLFVGLSYPNWFTLPHLPDALCIREISFRRDGARIPLHFKLGKQQDFNHDGRGCTDCLIQERAHDTLRDVTEGLHSLLKTADRKHIFVTTSTVQASIVRDLMRVVCRTFDYEHMYEVVTFMNVSQLPGDSYSPERDECHGHSRINRCTLYKCSKAIAAFKRQKLKIMTDFLP